MSSSAPPASLEQMESRLAALELQLLGASPSEIPPVSADVSSRLARLMRPEADRRPPGATPSPAPSRSGGTDAAAARKKADTKRAAIHDDLRAADRLLSELDVDPVAGPSAGGGAASAPPIGYRRMEVLASADAMRRDMDLLGRIRDLTLIGTKAAPGGGGVDASNVVNCPVVASERYDLPSEKAASDRLERLCFRVAGLHQRTTAATQRADEMLNSYGKIMMALSEKIVLAEEQIKG